MALPARLALGTAPGAAAPADRELKFAVPAGRAGAVRRWLCAVCRPDARYPGNIVSTIYYDTPDLPSLGEKLNSDHLKLKIRVRWYTEPGGVPAGPAFVEAKLREGARRAKVRVPLDAPADAVAAWPLDDPRWAAVPWLLRSRGIAVRGAWQPVLRLRYRRDRYVEPASRARISFDAGIVADAVNRRFVPACDPTPLPAGVLEVKGGPGRLPSPLRALVRFGARHQSFSKYLAVYQQATRSTF